MVQDVIGLDPDLELGSGFLDDGLIHAQVHVRVMRPAERVARDIAEYGLRGLAREYRPESLQGHHLDQPVEPGSTGPVQNIRCLQAGMLERRAGVVEVVVQDLSKDGRRIGGAAVKDVVLRVAVDHAEGLTAAPIEFAGDRPSTEGELLERVGEVIWLDVDQITNQTVADVVVGGRIHQMGYAVRRDLAGDGSAIEVQAGAAIRDIVHGLRPGVGNVNGQTVTIGMLIRSEEAIVVGVGGIGVLRDLSEPGISGCRRQLVKRQARCVIGAAAIAFVQKVVPYQQIVTVGSGVVQDESIVRTKGALDLQVVLQIARRLECI